MDWHVCTSHRCAQCLVMKGVMCVLQVRVIGDLTICSPVPGTGDAGHMCTSQVWVMTGTVHVSGVDDDRHRLVGGGAVLHADAVCLPDPLRRHQGPDDVRELLPVQTTLTSPGLPHLRVSLFHFSLCSLREGE